MARNRGKLISTINGIRPSSMRKFLSFTFKEDFQYMTVKPGEFIAYVNKGVDVEELKRFRTSFDNVSFYAVMAGGTDFSKASKIEA